MPLLWVKREVYDWIRTGQKTIDVRKGKPRNGSLVTIQCGPHPTLKFSIVKREIGSLTQIIRQDNFKLVIPTAQTLEDSLDYLKAIYGKDEGVFTAYYFARTPK